MKSLIKWSINNTPAMNTLMIGVLIMGAVSLFTMRREIFPEFDLEIIFVSVPYPGATPEDVEEAICQRIEEAISSIDGVKKQTSVAREGSGTVILELEPGVDVQRTLSEVRSEIDRIPSFPDLAEDPQVEQITLRNDAIRVGVIGPGSDTGSSDTNNDAAELRLREVAEDIRNELKDLPTISQARLIGVPQFQIDIEISEDTLREYGLTLKEVAQIVRRENIEMPGGKMRTPSQEVLIRGKNKQMVGTEIAKIPLVTRPDGVVLTVGDLGKVRDEFADITSINRVNGKPAAVIAVEKTSSEDLLAIVGEVQDFIKTKEMPEGYSLVTWADQSVMVRDRLELLSRNGIQGMILVFIVLAIFLEMRLAFWVALGVPLSILGACGILLYSGQTLNMLSMFAFLMALGILVDDAIVVGENVYAHRQRGSGFTKAAIEGTVEVLPSVLASVCTTMIAFAPLLFVPGVIGKFIAVMPLAIIAMLLISLFEVTFILPCHLAHDHKNGGGTRFGAGKVGRYCRNMPPLTRYSLGILIESVAFLLAQLLYPFRRLGALFGWLNRKTDYGMNNVIERFYLPTLRWSLENKAVVVSTAIAILIVFGGLVKGQVVPFVFFPKLDSNMIQASIAYPDGTPASVTDAATRRMEKAMLKIDAQVRKSDKRPLTTLIHRAVGTSPVVGSPLDPSTGDSHTGGVMVELVESANRTLTSEEISTKWRELAGTFPGAESISFGSQAHGPGGKPIEFKLLRRGKDMRPLEKAAELCKAQLRTYPGLTDITDDSRPGKWEFQLKKKDEARAMGLSLADLTETVRASYYGEEVMRLQRGRHEVKLMVRYPRDDRRSLANFDDIRVRSGGFERPLTELVDVNVRRGYSVINRKDQFRSITVTADIKADIKHGSSANANEISAELKDKFLPKLLAKKEFQDIQVSWDGQQRQSQESMAGLKYGMAISLVAMFGLLTFEFRSYLQPLLILAIIPFGAVGAILGHLVMGLDVTIFSMFGMVALSGVVINDSIVLIDFINHRVRDGIPVKDALLDAGRQRFRPVLLTTITTVAGLLPLLTETSMQAQVLIPMATSLCFGLMFSTVLILLLVPTFYMIHAKVTAAGSNGSGFGEMAVAGQPCDWDENDDSLDGLSED